MLLFFYESGFAFAIFFSMSAIQVPGRSGREISFLNSVDGVRFMLRRRPRLRPGRAGRERERHRRAPARLDRRDRRLERPRADGGHKRRGLDTPEVPGNRRAVRLRRHGERRGRHHADGGHDPQRPAGLLRLRHRRRARL